MAAKKKAEPVVSQPLTSQAASTAARATEPNADDVQSSQAPAEVQATIPIAPTPDEGLSSQAPAVHVTIPIDPYPDIDEPYLHSFELLRSNVYEAVFSLGRIANAFRFSQFLFHYRMFGSEIGVPDDFFACIIDCLDSLDRETRSAIAKLLRKYIRRPRHTAGQNEPIEYESWWEDLSCDDRSKAPFFRLPLSELYEFSLNTRAKAPVNTESQDFSGWLDCFEALYENIRQGDQHLADWMMAGWNVDRLVRPEMDTDLLWTFDSTRARCGVGDYSTRDPVSRNASARIICSSLGSGSTTLELPRSLVEFETTVSNWVRLLADEQLRADHLPVANTTPKGPAKEDSGENNGNKGRLPKSPKKKGTQEAAQKDVLKAFLLTHHRFESKKDLNLEPATMVKMMASVGKSGVDHKSGRA